MERKIFIIPYPQKIEQKEGTVDVSSLFVMADSDEIYKFAEILNDRKAEVEVKFKKDCKLNEEHYIIDISQSGIDILYGEVEGAYRAFTTLKQIISQAKNNEIICMHIEDYPSIRNRGYMLDISRGKIPTLEHLKNMVDILSDLKYNQLQLYMDSFVYEYKNFPEYIKDTEPLTGTEIKELDRYCRERFINLVPNQNGFGHMGAWTAKKELSHLAITGKDGTPSQTLNPFLDGSIELLDKIYDGFFDSFSSDLVNIGMDEPVELGLNETKEMCEKYGVGKVYTDYLNKVCKLISDKYNKTPMFWDDIVFKHEEQIDNVPENAIFMQWGYETEHHYDRNCRKLSEKELKFYVCPGTSMWGSFTGRTNNAIANISKAAECGSYYGAEGFLLTEWGDGGNPQFPSTTFFTLTYGGAVSWNCGDHNVEIDYAIRRKRICDCKKYIDKYLYNCKGEKSLSDIVYRMGNYYLLEDCTQFNSTELNYCIYDTKKPAEEKIAGFKRVVDYMTNLRNELDDIDADEIAVREIKANCDMVILIAAKLSDCDMDYKTGFSELKSEFEKLWLMKNHRSGIDICMREIAKVLGNV